MKEEFWIYTYFKNKKLTYGISAIPNVPSKATNLWRVKAENLKEVKVMAKEKVASERRRIKYQQLRHKASSPDDRVLDYRIGT